MLTLSRSEGEIVRIGDNIAIVVHRINGKQVKLSFEAPRDVEILREELYQAKQRQKDDVGDIRPLLDG
ncbi:MAG: carbon storage regulator [Gammaproteobacteria bacterium]|nr:carbon storage regulator [Gammaproteobacteria bacterium]